MCHLDINLRIFMGQQVTVIPIQLSNIFWLSSSKEESSRCDRL